MKKLKLFALGLLGASMFMTTSCSDDPEEDAIGPILSVNETAFGDEDGVVEVTPGSTVRFEWEARKGDADLDQFRIMINGNSVAVTSGEGNEIPYKITNADDELYSDHIEFEVGDAQSTQEYSFEVTDKDGLSKTVTITVEVANESTPLTTENFEWTRVGSTPGLGLAQFGLKWTQNTSTNAIVAVDGAQMVELSSAAWDDITTRESLANAFVEGTLITEYDGVSVTANGSYDDVLAVQYNSEYYLIHITDGDVNTSGAGTTVVISGQYKE